MYGVPRWGGNYDDKGFEPDERTGAPWQGPARDRFFGVGDI